MAVDRLPRIDLRKLTGSDVAGRREAVAVLGDALRERGAVRVEGHGVTADEPRVLAVVADHLLEGLAEYFGLPAAAFAHAAGPTSSAAGLVAIAGALPDVLLAVLPEPPADLEVRAGGGTWSAAGARREELVVVPGGALATLTGRVVPAGGLRWREAAAARATMVTAAHPAELLPLREFDDARR